MIVYLLLTKNFSTKMPPILITVFAEFPHTEKLRQFLSSDYELYVSAPCNSTNQSELKVLKSNIKIFINDNVKAAYASAEAMEKDGFARIVTDQLYYTNPTTKQRVALPKDRIILECVKE
jgi:hypothetical protein